MLRHAKAGNTLPRGTSHSQLKAQLVEILAFHRDESDVELHQQSPFANLCQDLEARFMLHSPGLNYLTVNIILSELIAQDNCISML